MRKFKLIGSRYGPKEIGCQSGAVKGNLALTIYERQRVLSRRSFVGAGAGLAALHAFGTGAIASPRARYFLLKSYLLKDASLVERMGSCLQLARIGMAGRLETVAPAIVLEAVVAGHMPQLVSVSAFDSLTALAEMKRKLAGHEAALQAMAQGEVGGETSYQALNETVLEAVESYPPFPVQASRSSGMFELRTYHSTTESQMWALHELLIGPAGSIFRRCGIHPMLYGSKHLGIERPSFTYLTPFDNLTSREKAWAAFSADQQWVQARAEAAAKYGRVSNVVQVALFKAAKRSLAL